MCKYYVNLLMMTSTRHVHQHCHQPLMLGLFVSIVIDDSISLAAWSGATQHSSCPTLCYLALHTVGLYYYHEFLNLISL
jgi:hypothetical protein